MVDAASEGRFPIERQARLAIFASGRGSNLASLLAAFPPTGEAPLAAVRLVVSDRKGALALDVASRAGVPAEYLSFGRERERFEEAADEALRRHAIDLVCLAGFLRVLSPAFVLRWRGRMVNIHPSLLPAFRGLHAQRQAIEAGVTHSGCTVHFVDAEVDAGRTIVQRRVRVEEGDDASTLAERILAEEHVAFPEAVRLVLRGEVTP